MSQEISMSPALLQPLSLLFDDECIAYVVVINVRDRSVVFRCAFADIQRCSSSSSSSTTAAAASSASSSSAHGKRPQPPPSSLIDTFVLAVAGAATPFERDDSDDTAASARDEGGSWSMLTFTSQHWDVSAYRCPSSIQQVLGGGVVANHNSNSSSAGGSADRWVMITFAKK